MSGRRGLAGCSLKPVIIIAGPTASGKSALALQLADRAGGVIINADSQQIYRDLPILTAQPDAAAQARVPHRLYGVLDAAERGSVGWWRERALAEIERAHADGRLPILVGGTGLYLRALQFGLAPVPAVPAPVRAEAAALFAEIGGAAFRELLARVDPTSGAKLAASDRQRLLRAWEVVQATGRPLSEWHARATAPARLRYAMILVMPPRPRLYAACDGRFAAMIRGGALEEAARLAARDLSPELPAMKAVGLRELLRHLQGETSLAEAVAAAQQATRRYAKRQMTWFRHQMDPDIVVEQEISPDLLSHLQQFIEQFRLTGES